MTTPVLAEGRLLQAARGGDEDAFRRLLEAYRDELHAHCYRMLGSVHDADDALQDASLRAWRFLPRFEGRSSLRSWLYRVATNACLDLVGRRPRRMLPVDRGPRTDPRLGPGEPVVEAIWIEPYPDEELGVPDGLAGPEARLEQREGVELAFVAALQLLPATQRAVLVLREVLGFSARETAETLDTTVASVNSALQRARRTIADRLPDRTQQATLRDLGDHELRAVVDAYVDAWERCDVDAVVAMLTEDATLAMPPLASWFGGRDDVAAFLASSPLSGALRWRALPTRASGQPALGFYVWDEATRAYEAFALNVLTLEGRRVSDVVAFVTRATAGAGREPYGRWDDQPSEADRVELLFGRFGLPARVGPR